MNVSVIYIDDDPDPSLSRFFAKTLPRILVETNCDIETNYEEVKYEPKDGYKSILDNEVVRRSNIAFIDSKLFTTDTAANGVLTGEELYLILRKVYPYIELFVITQNEDRKVEGLPILSKYDPTQSSDITVDKYYTDELLPLIKSAIDRIRLCEYAIEKAQNADPVLLDKIQSLLEGDSTYDDLTKSDLDNAIENFEKIKELIADAEKRL